VDKIRAGRCSRLTLGPMRAHERQIRTLEEIHRREALLCVPPEIRIWLGAEAVSNGGSTV